MPAKKSLGIYLHFPFCKTKCRYCDFCSFPIGDRTDDFDIYLNRLKSEAIDATNRFSPEYFIDSIYFGGGTPSLIEPVKIREILEIFYSFMELRPDAEITLEANPGTVDLAKLEGYLDAGINRLSLGAQSFTDSTLRYLGRVHDSSQAEEAILMAKKAGFSNISIDLIFGIPGTDIADIYVDLNKAISLDVSHISLYSLEVEEGTPIYEDIASGKVELIDDLLDRTIYHMASEFLQQNNFPQYEISNFAKPGMESRHNNKYWMLDDYLGLGLSAHSFMHGIRFANTDKMVDYLSSKSRSQMVNIDTNRSKSTEMEEFVWLGLRRNIGISKSKFLEKFGIKWENVFGNESENLINRGLLEESGDSIFLTKLGRDLANRVFIEFIGEMED